MMDHQFARSRVGSAILAFACLTGLSGCAATVQQAAKEATPAAVEGAIEGAKQPDTRNDIATILADPEIRAATSSLSAAFVAGALDGLSDEQRAELRRLTDAVVRGMGAAAAKALRDDIGPQLSKTLADAVDRSLEQTLNEHTEQRLQAMTAAVARGMAQGLGESLFDSSGRPGPEWSRAIGLIARDITHQAAFGIDDAVRSAESGDSGEPEPQVLAALGTVASWTRTLPMLILGGLTLALLGCIAALAWLAARLQHYKRESLAREQVVRERSELRLPAHDRAPRSEPATHAG
ncbi:MAG TPA: hypothetical protein VJU61_09960 [Polyangiaceae bacterium]|nr:hypothetical protein [Polyangiaceae bacterium]